MSRRKYSDALTYHRQALTLSPQNASTYVALAYVYQLTGRYMQAVEHYHKALGLRRDDTFSTTMLNYSVERLIDGDDHADDDTFALSTSRQVHDVFTLFKQPCQCRNTVQ